MKKIQIVEINTHYEIQLHCPFCGCTPITEDGEATPCVHTLFVAHDEGFVFRSDRFNENLKLEGLSEGQVQEQVGDTEHGYDGLTSTVTLADSIKFASYVGAPSFFGSYIGFAPLDVE